VQAANSHLDVQRAVLEHKGSLCLGRLERLLETLHQRTKLLALQAGEPAHELTIELGLDRALLLEVLNGLFVGFPKSREVLGEVRQPGRLLGRVGWVGLRTK
jgi:hypothetical protein